MADSLGALKSAVGCGLSINGCSGTGCDRHERPSTRIAASPLPESRTSLSWASTSVPCRQQDRGHQHEASASDNLPEKGCGYHHSPLCGTLHLLSPTG